MTNTMIGRRVRMAVLCGLLLATSSVVEAQGVPEGTVTLGGMTVSVSAIESLTKSEKTWVLKWKGPAGSGEVTSTDPPLLSSSYTSPGVEALPRDRGLTTDQESLIRRELEAMVAQRSGQSSASLKRRLREKAEAKVEAFLKIGKSELYQDSPLLTKLQDLVDTTIREHQERKHPSREKVDVQNTGRAREKDERDTGTRCECEFCHPMHRAGTCSLPCAPLTIPLLPTAAASHAPTYDLYPSAQKHRLLHGHFCRCAWCRGW
jgi:hypothetical protein